MTSVPARPMIYHILHKDRLQAVLQSNGLYCDEIMRTRTDVGSMIGMSDIKDRRLRLPVECHTDTFVGQYVPFYFCPRSIMMYVIWKANHPALTYRGGQGPIVTLQADLREVVDHAARSGVEWCFSLANAGTRYTAFRKDLAQLDELNWSAIGTDQWNAEEIKEAKQSEFLFRYHFPWSLVRRVGVYSASVQNEVSNLLASAPHRPEVHVRRDWYY
jgi:hypothetical protein